MVICCFIFSYISFNIHFNLMRKYIHYLLITSLILLFNQGCNKKQKKILPEKDFKESYKEQKSKGKLENTENLDTIRNIYSNYYFKVGYDAQDNWTVDKGMNDHTIFRTYQKDSAITFMINVIEFKTSKANELNIWEIRKKNGAEQFDKKMISNLEMQSRSKIQNFQLKKSYLKNHTCIKMSFETLIKELDFEYTDTNIMYQTVIENRNYTFGLSIPKMYYELKPEYYENMFRYIYFLHNKEKTNKIINSKK